MSAAVNGLHSSNDTTLGPVVLKGMIELKDGPSPTAKNFISEAVNPSLAALQIAKLAKKILKQITVLTKAVGLESLSNEVTKTFTKSITLISTVKFVFSKIIDTADLIFVRIEYSKKNIQYEHALTAHKSSLKELMDLRKDYDSKLTKYSQKLHQNQQDQAQLIADRLQFDNPTDLGPMHTDSERAEQKVALEKQQRALDARTRDLAQKKEIIDEQMNELSTREATLKKQEGSLVRLMSECNNLNSAISEKGKKQAISIPLRIPKIMNATLTLTEWLGKLQKMEVLSSGLGFLSDIAGIIAKVLKIKDAKAILAKHREVVDVISHSNMVFKAGPEGLEYRKERIAAVLKYRKDQEAKVKEEHKQEISALLKPIENETKEEVLAKLKAVGVGIKDFRNEDEASLQKKWGDGALIPGDLILIDLAKLPKPPKPTTLLGLRELQNPNRPLTLCEKLEKDGIIVIADRQVDQLRESFKNNEALTEKYTAFKETSRRLALEALKLGVLDKMRKDGVHLKDQASWGFLILTAITVAAGAISKFFAPAAALPSLAMFILSIGLTVGEAVYLRRNQSFRLLRATAGVTFQMMLPKIGQAYYAWRLSSAESNLESANEALGLLDYENPYDLIEYLKNEPERIKYLPQALAPFLTKFDVSQLEKYQKIRMSEKERYTAYQKATSAYKKEMEGALKGYRESVTQLQKKLNTARLNDSVLTKVEEKSRDKLGKEGKQVPSNDPSSICQTLIQTLIDTEFWKDKYAVKTLEKYIDFRLRSDILEGKPLDENQKNIIRDGLIRSFEKSLTMDDSAVKKWVNTWTQFLKRRKNDECFSEPKELKEFLAANPGIENDVSKELLLHLEVEKEIKIAEEAKWSTEYKEIRKAQLKKSRSFARDYDDVYAL